MFYLVAVASIFTASFFPFVVITCLIVIHEIGHFLMAYLLGGEVLKILIYPLGGISKFTTSYNISILKEFLILLFGPLFQFLAWFFLILLFPSKEHMISVYHFGILFFNLLPIYPLDGGKLLCLFFQLFLSYKRAFYLTFICGYIFLLFIYLANFYSFSLNLIFIFMFLFIKLSQEVWQVPYFYEKFLLERYLNSYHFSKSRMIDNDNSFKRGYCHLIKEGDQYYLEREYLEKKYKKYKNC